MSRKKVNKDGIGRQLSIEWDDEVKVQHDKGDECSIVGHNERRKIGN